ncbi:metal ABC transporter substrate-binding protein [Sporomusa aerivorans]|uniref:metal ABC transporter substrate-binding protein n=1 Tax=Sporomusa aerivorans TaxID=204936 RepID=UPI00352B0CCC
MRKIAILLCLTLLAMSLAAGVCSAAGSAKPVIVTTIYPLYDFTKQVTGGNADVKLLVPAGVEPHDWEPSPADLITIQNCDVFIYNGAGLEAWVDKIQNTVLKGKKVVNAAKSVPVLAAQYDEEGGPAEAGDLDPHIWLDPVNVMSIVDAIRQAVAGSDPVHKLEYQKNAEAYKQQLNTLHQQYVEGLQGRKTNEIVTSHAAFGYMAKRYGFQQIAIMGLSPEAEPTAAKMAETIEYVKRQGIKYIFFETLVNPRLSEVIAAEAGAQTLVLNPIEGLTDDEIAQGQNYITEMQMNLVNLKYALGIVK